MMLKKSVLLIFGTVLCVIAQAQLVNIEARRIKSDTVRFVLTDGVGFSYNDNDGKQLLQLNNNLACQFKSKDLRHIYFLLNNYKLVKAKGKDFINVFFAHLRYNYRLTEEVSLESFFQYQNNLVLLINARVIYGAGMRCKVLNTKYFWAYLGATYMYEFEHSKSCNTTAWQHRLSNYLSFTGHLPKVNIDISGTFYYQPLFSYWRDYRILSDLDVSSKVSQHLAVFVALDYFLDSYTPSNLEQYTFNMRFGFRLNY